MSETLNQIDKLGGKVLENIPGAVAGAGQITGDVAKQLQAIASTAGTHVNDAAQKFLSFAEAEAPNLLWEILTMARVQSGTRLAIFACLLIYFGSKFYSRSKTIWSENFQSEGHIVAAFVGYLFCGLVSANSLYMLYCHINEWILPFVAPRLYLLDYMKELVIQLKG